MCLLTSSAAAVGPAPAAGHRSSRPQARVAVVALLPGLAAPLNSAERTVVRAGIPPLKPRTAKPLALRPATVSKVAASRASERLFPGRRISLPAGSSCLGAPVAVR